MSTRTLPRNALVRPRARRGAAPGPSLRLRPWWSWVRRGVFLLFLGVVGTLLFRYARTVDWDDVQAVAPVADLVRPRARLQGFTRPRGEPVNRIAMVLPDPAASVAMKANSSSLPEIVENVALVMVVAFVELSLDTIASVAKVLPVTAAMVVTSLAVSLVVLVSPPPETVAVLVTEAGALLATFTVRVMAG